MKKMIIIVGLLFYISVVYSQNVIRGFVYDSRNHKPMQCALITAYPQNTSVLSDSNGFFSVEITDSAMIIVEYVGYNKWSSNKYFYFVSSPIMVNMTTNVRELDPADIIIDREYGIPPGPAER